MPMWKRARHAILFFSLFVVLGSTASVGGEPALVWQQVRVIEGAEVEANFGFSVAISGDVMMIGAPYDDQAFQNAGAIYVYDRLPAPAGWTLGQTLTVDDPFFGDQLGWALDLQGDRAVISAIGDDDIDTNTGAVYVYERVGGSWQETQKIVPDDLTRHAEFGVELALDGDTFVAASRSRFGNFPHTKVYVYTLDAGVWTLEQQLDPDGAAPFDLLAVELDLHGDTVIVGNPVNGVEAAHVFARQGTSWSLEASLVHPSPEANDQFGTTVAVRDDVAMVTAIGRREVHLFRRDAGTWAFGETRSVDGDGDCFGCYVTVFDGERAAVSAAGSTQTHRPGNLRTFTIDSGNGSLVEEQRLNGIGAESGRDDLFSYAIALAGNELAAGTPIARFGGVETGGVYLYELAPGPVLLFANGFEEGDTSAWSDVVEP